MMANYRMIEILQEAVVTVFGPFSGQLRQCFSDLPLYLKTPMTCASEIVAVLAIVSWRKSRFESEIGDGVLHGAVAMLSAGTPPT